MGIEQVPHTEHRRLRMQESLPHIQAMLALEAYKQHHPEVLVDVLHPEGNMPDIRRAAMLEWVGDASDESPSGRFREYAELHTDEEIAVPDDLPRLLKEISIH